MIIPKTYAYRETNASFRVISASSLIMKQYILLVFNFLSFYIDQVPFNVSQFSTALALSYGDEYDANAVKAVIENIR
jgi:hypothetical protein